MGEIANDMINGQSCSWCGVYFEKPHYYPVACKNCWKEAMKDYNDEDDLKMDTAVQRALFKEVGEGK